MNERKIAFIICTNNKMYFEECVHYLSYLNVPDGFETELLAIEDAEYMTKAYNQAMSASDAKYKVYLHQDVFILHKDFLYEILEIFKNPDVGMIGMAGTDDVRKFMSTLMWSKGSVYMTTVKTAYPIVFGEIANTCAKVQAIDGMIMVTQYDYPWREDKYTGWHFYDLAQSMVFLENGKDIVVPKQETPWVMHDHGVISYDQYEDWKEIFWSDYGKYILSISK